MKAFVIFSLLGWISSLVVGVSVVIAVVPHLLWLYACSVVLLVCAAVINAASK